MYLVKCITDGKEYTLLDLRIPRYMLIEPILNIGLNRTGSLTFKVPRNHPSREKISVMRSIIKVFIKTKTKEKWMYSGRITNTEEDFYRTGKLECEGILSYLLDTRVRPYEFSGDPKDYVDQLRIQHNSQVGSGKQFEKGDIDVIDADGNGYTTRSATGYPTTMEEMMDKAVNAFGAYVSVREEDGKIYLDCISSLPHNTQKILYGKNLLDINKTLSTSNFYTAVIPLGAKQEDSEERLTIKYYCPDNQPDDWEDYFRDYCTRSGEEGAYEYTFLTGDTAPEWQADTYYYGLDFVYNKDLRSQYDVISTTCEWDDVTLQSNLFRKGKSYLGTCLMSESMKVSAVDLSLTTEEVEELFLGWIKFESKAHGIDAELLLSEIEIPLLDPLNANFTIGVTVDTLTEKTVKSQKEFENKIIQISSKIFDSVAHATDMITGAKGGYIVIVRNDDGFPERLLFMDAPSVETAKNVIQINKNGIGFSNTGIDGPYTNAWTIDGQLLADFITAGTMQAERIRGGILQSNNYEEGSAGMKIDLDNGRIDTNYLNMGDYLKYQAGATIPFILGGWQIKKTTLSSGREAEYWDTVDTQANGIAAYGPWVVWGGWDGGDVYSVDSYKFVVLEDGSCKAMEFLNGSRKEWKEKIEKYETDAISQIRGTDVCRYKIKGRKTDGEHIGFVIGDGYNVSPELLSKSGGAIDLYKAIAVAYKAIQELDERIDRLEKGDKK